jgi:hypothetical protein
VAIIFAQTDEGTFTLRKALYRMVLSRARRSVSDPADVETLQDYYEAVSLFRMEANERARVGDAILQGAVSLRADVVAGKPTEEPVRDGAAEYLGEFIEFMTSHLEDRR